MTHDTYEEGRRNRPVGADRRSNQTCLLVWFLCGWCLVKLVVPREVICGSRRVAVDTWEGTFLILRQLKKGRFTSELVVAEG